MGQPDVPAMSANDMESFRTRARTSAYTCVLRSCPRATVGFDSAELRDLHHLEHTRKYRCTYATCQYPPFPSSRALKMHISATHSVVGPRKTIRQIRESGTQHRKRSRPGLLPPPLHRTELTDQTSPWLQVTDNVHVGDKSIPLPTMRQSTAKTIREFRSEHGYDPKASSSSNTDIPLPTMRQPIAKTMREFRSDRGYHPKAFQVLSSDTDVSDTERSTDTPWPDFDNSLVQPKFISSPLVRNSPDLSPTNVSGIERKIGRSSLTTSISDYADALLKNQRDQLVKRVP